MKCKLLIIVNLICVLALCGCSPKTDKNNKTEFVKEKVSSQSELTQAFASGVTPLFTSDDEALILFADEAQEEIINVVYGEEIIAKIEADYHNMYDEKPEAAIKDLDKDGKDEIIITLRKYTGSITAYDLYIIDKKEDWNVIFVSNIGEMVSESINYKYDESQRSLTFDVDSESVMVFLPTWTENYPFENIVEYDKRYRIDINSMTVEVVPHICMKDSLPVTNLSLFYKIEYLDDTVKLSFEKYEIHEKETDFWFIN